MDLDRTLWDGDCAALWRPLRLAGPGAAGSNGTELDIFPEAAPALRALHAAGCRLGIVSLSSADATARWLLNRWGLSGLFEPALIHIGTPKARGLAAVCRSCGVEPNSVAVV